MHQKNQTSTEVKTQWPEKIQAINSYVIPVINYAPGTISWTQNEIAKLEMKTRKTLNMYGGLRQRSDIHKLYATRNKHGRVLGQVEFTILSEQMALLNYINYKRSTEPLVNVEWHRKMYSVLKIDYYSRKKTLQSARIQEWNSCNYKSNTQQK